MIYIVFIIVLVGVIFGRRFLGGMMVINILVFMILMVVGFSWMDFEIMFLVLVLKLYWFIIYVFLEVGSYGFLMLGVLIGVLNFIFMIF